MQHSGAVEIILILNFVLYGVVCATAAAKMGRSLFLSPLGIYLVFHGISFVVRPAAIYYFEFYRILNVLGFMPNNATFFLSILVTMIFLVIFSLAFGAATSGLSNFNTRLRGAPKVHFKAIYSPTKEDVIAFACVVILILPIALYSYSESATLHERMTQVRGLGIRIMTEGSGYMAIAYYTIGPIILLFAFITRFSLLSIILIIGYVVVRVDAGWGRFSFVILMMSIFIYFLTYREFRKRYALAGLVGVSIFQYAGRSRGEYDQAWWTILDNADYANFDILTFLIHHVPEETNNHTYFTQYLQLFTEPIPRAIWSGKPIGPPIEFFDLAEYGNTTGHTYSIVGDGWLSLGIVGVVIMATFTGVITGRIFTCFLRRLDDPVFVFVYATSMPLLLFWYRDAGIHFLRLGLFLVGPVLLWLAVRALLRRSRWLRTTKRV